MILYSNTSRGLLHKHLINIISVIQNLGLTTSLVITKITPYNLVSTIMKIYHEFLTIFSLVPNSFFLFLSYIIQVIINGASLVFPKSMMLENFNIICIIKWLFRMTKDGLEDWNFGFGIISYLLYISSNLLQIMI